jgi:hypothetical protein
LEIFSRRKEDVNKAAFDQNPSGLLAYRADGRMMAIISDDARKPLSIADEVAPPTEERAKAYSTFMAYAGRCAFTCDKVVTPRLRLPRFKTGSIRTEYGL